MVLEMGIIILLEHTLVVAGRCYGDLNLYKKYKGASLLLITMNVTKRDKISSTKNLALSFITILLAQFL